MAISFVMPPGGLAGFRQMTAASQRALFPGGPSNRSSGSRRRRKSRAKSSAKRGTRARSRTPKFGSPAWQKKYKVGAHAKKRRRK